MDEAGIGTRRRTAWSSTDCRSPRAAPVLHCNEVGDRPEPRRAAAGSRARTRIPVVEMIDARLRSREGDGYRYGGHARGLGCLAAVARGARRGRPCTLGCDSFRPPLTPTSGRSSSECDSSRVTGRGMPAQRCSRSGCATRATAFYSAPAAWNEIGFGGPAYPRGYKNVGLGRREPLEVRRSRPPGIRFRGRPRAKRHDGAIRSG